MILSSDLPLDLKGVVMKNFPGGKPPDPPFWSLPSHLVSAPKISFVPTGLSFQTTPFMRTTVTPPEEEELSRGGANEAIALKQFKLLSMKGVLIALYQKFCDGLDWPWVWDTD